MSLIFRRLSSVSGLSLISEDCHSLFQMFFIDFTRLALISEGRHRFRKIKSRFDRNVIGFQAIAIGFRIVFDCRKSSFIPIDSH